MSRLALLIRSYTKDFIRQVGARVACCRLSASAMFGSTYRERSAPALERLPCNVNIRFTVSKAPQCQEFGPKTE
jgi:hypothetical protein